MANSSLLLSDMESSRYSSGQTVVCRCGTHKTWVRRTRLTLGDDVVEPYLIRVLPIQISDLAGLTDRSFLSMKWTPPRISRSSITSPSKWHVQLLFSVNLVSPTTPRAGGGPSAGLADWDVFVILATMHLELASRTILRVAQCSYDGRLRSSPRQGVDHQ